MEAPLHCPNIDDDFVEENYESLPKRPRFTTSPLKQEPFCCDPALEISTSHWNPLDEPSPLGLKLRKSPSLLELIQLRLSNGTSCLNSITTSDSAQSTGKRNATGVNPSSSTEKMKASNFNATVLRIGSWEYVSKYEGDLLVKCYFAKHKLVWEILDGVLKSKIEIQWSDIVGLKVECPEDGNGSITIVLSRQPGFYRETNPQPRKHTLWHASSDFTDGQASLFREHYVQCPPGVLNKHFEKLIQCDDRLNALSKQPKIVMASPYFESQSSVFENSEESRSSGSNMLHVPVEGSPISVIQDSSVVHSPHLVSFERVQTPSSNQKTSRNLASSKASESEVMLEKIAQHFFSETHCTTSLDERSIMKKVNSFDCLLQNTTKDCCYSQHERHEYYEVDNPEFANDYLLQEGSTKGVSCGMSREDSLGDLLSSLPRIISLPQLPKVLLDIVEDDEHDIL